MHALLRKTALNIAFSYLNRLIWGYALLAGINLENH
jgi:hypothetical protein